MKTLCALVYGGALLGAAFPMARADGGATSSKVASAPTPASGSPTGPWLMWSPPSHPLTGEAPEWNGATGDGVGEGGSSSTEGTDPQNAERIAEQTYQANVEKANHPEELNVEQTAKQQAYDDDWMLRGYTDQLKKHHLEKADYTNPYLVADPSANSPSLLTEDPLLNPPAEKKTVRKGSSIKSAFDDTSMLTPRKPLGSVAFQPLLAPLTPNGNSAHADSDGLAPIDSDDSAASLLPVPDAQSLRPTGASINDGSLPSLLDVPGLTAASQGGATPSTTIDLDDSGANRRARPADDFLLPTPPVSDVSEFFRKQAEGLVPRGVAGGMATVMPMPKPHPVIDEEPIAKPALSSGIRVHVDDPFDLLRR